MTDNLPDISTNQPSNSAMNDGRVPDSGSLPTVPTLDQSVPEGNVPSDNNHKEHTNTVKKKTLFSRDLWNLRKKKQNKEKEEVILPAIEPKDGNHHELQTRNLHQPIEPVSAPAPVHQNKPITKANQPGIVNPAPTGANQPNSAHTPPRPASSPPKLVNPSPSQPPAASTSWEIVVDQAITPKIIGEKKKLLYVEDNPDNRLLIERVLFFEGYDIVFAENAIEALVSAEKHSFDLVLMDINLPDIDGYTLTSQLRQLPKFESVPIIALTANVMKGDRERSFEAGCDGYIQKPINIDTLPGQIKEYLNAR